MGSRSAQALFLAQGGCSKNVVEAKTPFQDLESPEGKEAEDDRFQGVGSLILPLEDLFKLKP